MKHLMALLKQRKYTVIKLSLNGEQMTLADAPNINLVTLLDQQGYQTQKIAIAVNGSFVPRSRYATTVINDGDQIDVIQAVGGG